MFEDEFQNLYKTLARLDDQSFVQWAGSLMYSPALEESMDGFRLRVIESVIRVGDMFKKEKPNVSAPRYYTADDDPLLVPGEIIPSIRIEFGRKPKYAELIIAGRVIGLYSFKTLNYLADMIKNDVPDA